MPDASLGTTNTVRLPSGEISYTERGSGPPVVFVHGLLVNANLWRKVVPAIADEGFRCIAPDWPLGAHRVPMPAEADLSPPGVAKLIAEFLDALDLDDVTVVANDTGGAITQILMVNHPQRLGRVVLTPCDAFEDFLPQPFTSLPAVVRTVPGAVWMAGPLLRLPSVQRLPFVFGWLAKREIPAEIIDSYLRPTRDSRADPPRHHPVHRGRAQQVHAGRRRIARLVRQTGAAGQRRGRQDLPAPPVRPARRDPPGCPAWSPSPDSYTFVSEDQPAELARWSWSSPGEQ